MTEDTRAAVLEELRRMADALDAEREVNRTSAYGGISNLYTGLCLAVRLVRARSDQLDG